MFYQKKDGSDTVERLRNVVSFICPYKNPVYNFYDGI
nr:MAG TPA: hypothetical protein [Caudoviricetes sp.]